MRCKSCQYSLWNLPGRQCPECGLAFRPSDYLFARGAVAFKCPHCDQGYAGTSARGHLEPTRFSCLKCERVIDMDDTVVIPVGGMSDALTTPLANPWEEGASLGLRPFKRWSRTVSMTWLNGERLGEAIWRFGASRSKAADFAVFSWGALFGVVFCVMLLLNLPGALFFSTGRSALAPLGSAFISTLVAVLVPLAFTVALMLTTHATLRITGPLPIRQLPNAAPYVGIGRTWTVFAYTSGAVAPMLAAPFASWALFGPVLLALSCAMLQRAHRISGLRAVLATLGPPALAGTILAVVIFWSELRSGVHWLLTPTPKPAPATSINLMMLGRDKAAHITDVLIAWHRQHGTYPAHPIELITTDSLLAQELVVEPTDAVGLDFPGANATTPPHDPPTSASPIVAHRLGDFVFTYFGLGEPASDSTTTAPAGQSPSPRGLWLVIFWPDPARIADPELTGAVVVGLSEGGTRTIAIQHWPTALRDQNRLREQLGFPPLPEPSSIPHGQSATPVSTPPAP